MCSDGFFHLFGSFREDIGVVQRCDGTLNYFGARGGVNFEAQVGGFGPGRNGAQAKTGYFGWLPGFDLHLADGDGVAVALLDHELDAFRIALEDLREDETADHPTE